MLAVAKNNENHVIARNEAIAYYTERNMHDLLFVLWDCHAIARNDMALMVLVLNKKPRLIPGLFVIN
jgi:hypothetical protein